MARQVQNRVLDLVEQALGTTLEREVAPAWLKRPGPVECGDRWEVVRAIYTDLTRATLPDEMPPRERRSIDAVLTSISTGIPRIVEVDEVQHFTPPRARTLRLYPSEVETAFDRGEWSARSAAATRLRGGGFGRPCPPLFPAEGGRHLQRAFRDALADLLPGMHGWAPTLRIGDFEVSDWMHDDEAVGRMKALLAMKGVT
ncbi:hypothetical protein [Nocardioides sp. SYSU DS0651]|uniref:hypothetical protein n=1 Tax=Nocardioides sp. SYSU DS0651 TaxID=3415955 RepID=UPI003F4C1F15